MPAALASTPTTKHLLSAAAAASTALPSPVPRSISSLRYSDASSAN